MASTHWNDRPWYKAFSTPIWETVTIFPGLRRIWLADEMEAWLRSDEAQGFHVCDTAWPEDARLTSGGNRACHASELGWTWKFTDPATRVRFRSQFGMGTSGTPQVGF